MLERVNAEKEASRTTADPLDIKIDDCILDDIHFYTESVQPIKEDIPTEAIIEVKQTKST